MTKATPTGAIQMLLPLHERSDGSVTTTWPHLIDIRVPVPVRTSPEDHFREEHEPRVALHSPYTDDACFTGRHLFDIIESAAWREVERPDGSYFEECDFRARLTCVRCGKVAEWEGTRTEHHIGRLQVTPITAGPFVAQHIAGTTDMGTWLVYRDEVTVGGISWARGRRGRQYHVARLSEWPAGREVTGVDAGAALRRLAREAKAVEKP